MASDRVLITKEKIGRIGDAIRERKESFDNYTLDEMPDAIRTISGGGSSGGDALSIDVKIMSDILFINSNELLP